MHSEDPAVDEEDVVLDAHTFVPEHARHHFRAEKELEYDGEDRVAAEAREIDAARRLRSAWLVAMTHFPDANVEPPYASALYARTVERAITKRMTFESSLTQLTDYLTQLTTKAAALTDVSTDYWSTGVPTWLHDPRALPSLLQTQRRIVQTIESCLSDADVYLGMLEPFKLPPAVCYVACSTKSQMLRCVMQAPPRPPLLPPGGHAGASARAVPSNQPVSFEAMETLRPIVIEDVRDARLARAVHRFNENALAGPFAAFPLPSASQDTALGVLGMDSCRRAQRLLPETMSPATLQTFLVRLKLPDAAQELKRLDCNGQRFLQLSDNDVMYRPSFQRLKLSTRKRLIEIIAALKRGRNLHFATKPTYFIHDEDAMEFVQSVATTAGAFLDEYRRVHWLRLLAATTRDVTCTAYQVYGALLDAVGQALTRVERVCVWKVSSDRQVTAMACTQTPEDRLVPFLRWHDRDMKRLVLYKENLDANGALMKGSIAKVLLPPDVAKALQNSNQSHDDTLTDVHLRASYMVQWANRSVETVTWSQLALLLPVRAMNARHHQLSRMTDAVLAQTAKHVPSPASELTPTLSSWSIRLTDPNAVVIALRDPSRPATTHYVCQVDFQPGYCIPESALSFLSRAAAVTNESLVCVRGREARAKQRQQSSAQLRKRYQSMSGSPSADALRALDEVVSIVFAEIQRSLPGVQLSVHELVPDGGQLLCTFAADDSSMAVLDEKQFRSQTVAFSCLDARAPVVVQADGSELCLRIQARPGGAVVPNSDFPFVWQPLVYQDALVGVLSVHRFQAVTKGRHDEAHPEFGVLPFLEAMGSVLASAIYLKRRSHLLYQLQQLALEPIRSPRQWFFHACRAIKDVVVGSWKVRLVEIDFAHGKTNPVYELSELEKSKSKDRAFTLLEPLAFRREELLPATIGEHFNLSPAAIKALLLQSRDVTIDKPAPGETSIAHKYLGMQLLHELVTVKASAASRFGAASRTGVSAVDTRSWNDKYIKNALGVTLGSRSFAFAPIDALAQPTIGVFLTLTWFSSYTATPCEQMFVTSVADVLSTGLDALQRRVYRSHQRIAALQQFRDACSEAMIEAKARPAPDPAAKAAHALPTPAAELQNEAQLSLQEKLVTLVEQALVGPHVYIGLHEPFLQRIRYTSASKGSVMKGKHLKRGNGLSFLSLLDNRPIVVNSAQEAEASVDSRFGTMKLRYFSRTPATQQWPFVVVPVGSHGVLALDNLTKLRVQAGCAQPELGLLDFLHHVATCLAEALDVVRSCARAHREALRRQAELHVLTACEDLKPTLAPMFMQTIVIRQVERALHGVDAYIGIVQPLCEHIVFTCVSVRSGMLNRTVDTLESASFEVFASQQSLIIPQAHKHVLRQLTPRLQQIGERPVTGPFVCVPIPFVGVLSVDTFPGAAGGVFSPKFPEHGVLATLESLANHLGHHMRRLAETELRGKLQTLFQGNKTTLSTACTTVLRWISVCVPAAVQLAVVRLPPDQPHQVIAHITSLTHRASASWIRDVEEALLEHLNSTIESCTAMPQRKELVVVALEPTQDVAADDEAKYRTVLLVQRVHGAVWQYDIELLQQFLPELNTLIRSINERVAGIVRRRLALRELERLAGDTERIPSKQAIHQLNQLQAQACDIVAAAVSVQVCDVYLAERTRTADVLRFVASSSASLMTGQQISLTAADSTSLLSVQTLYQQRLTVVHLFDGKNDKLLRSLTSRKALRVYVVLPLGDDRVLCADSLHLEAFDVHRRLEADVIDFLIAAGRVIEDLTVTTQCRWSYDRLCALKRQRHTNTRALTALLLRITCDHVRGLHSQQLLHLADDFTGQYEVVCWYDAAMRRPLPHAAPHFCYATDCERQHLADHVHFERFVRLPMTNLPRTLDDCRSTLAPATGVDKRGAFASPCMTAMLDGALAMPRTAWCVFGPAKSTFSTVQHQLFYALAAVVSDVFMYVFKAMVLDSFVTELAFDLRERPGCKAFLVASLPSQGTGKQAVVDDAQPIVRCASDRHAPGSVVQGPLATKITRFVAEQSATAVKVVMSKQTAAPASAAPTLATPTSTTAPSAVATTQASTATAESPKAKTGRSLFRKPDFLKSKPKEKAPPPSVVSAPVPTVAEQETAPNTRCRFMVSLLLSDGRFRPCETDMIVVEAEMASTDVAKTAEKDLQVQVALAERLAQRFLRQPQGNEEHNGCGFGLDGGGGYYFMVLLKELRGLYQKEIVPLERLIRLYLNGLGDNGNGNGITQAQQQFDGTSSEQTAAMLVVLRAGLVLCGAKQDAVAKLEMKELLKDFIQTMIPRKVFEVDTTATATWAAMMRARSVLRAHDTLLLTQLQRTVALWVWRPLLQATTKSQPQPAATTADTVMLPVATAWALMTTMIGHMRYLKHVHEERQAQVAALNKKAVVLQCFARRVEARALLLLRRRQTKHAITIQCAFRQHLARRRLLFLRWTKAAVSIQRAYRLRRLRKSGHRPKLATLEMRDLAQRHGGSLAKHTPADADDDGDSLHVEWEQSMAGFDTFAAFAKSSAGKSLLRREEKMLNERIKQVHAQRETVTQEERQLEDFRDVFELLDVAGRGVLSHDTARELVQRFHVPLRPEELTDVLDMMDSDRSGDISFAEFARWYAAEAPVLRKRSKECGVLNRKDRQWFVEQSARSAVRKRYLAVRRAAGSGAPRDDNGSGDR
ncbi:TPA: hypothetical protein N0F65_006365 [Lagenidium giganteum]|uniref:EF-hand domain-containing protein n=1 Tax=Lagenidium giganteum TaxID=4803 RepID=A0AAV2YSM5_9STRA|nr:TPA: hypothetical protein N0F65_006365 [Lagenidium giganteum]